MLESTNPAGLCLHADIGRVEAVVNVSWGIEARNQESGSKKVRDKKLRVKIQQGRK